MRLTSLFFFLLLFLPCVASAQQVTFNDINLVDRSVSVYAVDGSGSVLVSNPGSTTSNLSLDLSSEKSYQIVIQPDHNTWFDDPRNALRYFISDATGQTLTFLVFALIFGGIVKIIFR